MKRSSLSLVLPLLVVLPQLSGCAVSLDEDAPADEFAAGDESAASEESAPAPELDDESLGAVEQELKVQQPGTSSAWCLFKCALERSDCKADADGDPDLQWWCDFLHGYCVNACSSPVLPTLPIMH
jgi:hypothetical protein